MTNSDDPCPHCGQKEWWLDSRIPDKSMKHVTILSYCNKCGWIFKRIVPLHLIKGKKLVEEKSRKQSAWQIFATEGLKESKPLKEIARLWKEQLASNNRKETGGKE
jgi:hypothetical protein